MDQDGVAPDTGGEGAPDAQRSRIRAKVNRPPPKTQSFGTGEPGFVKARGRSPGSDPTIESSKIPAGTLPGVEADRPFELSRAPEGQRARLWRRLRSLSLEEWIIAIGVLAALVVAVVLLARGRGHS